MRLLFSEWTQQVQEEIALQSLPGEVISASGFGTAIASNTMTL